MNLSVPSHAAFPKLRSHLPNPEQPWVLSKPLEERLKTTPPEPGKSYKKCLLRTSEPEYALVTDLFDANKPASSNIEKIYYIHKKNLLQIFTSGLEGIDEKAKESRTQIVDPRRTAIRDAWRDFTSDCKVTATDGTPLENIRMFHAWHGSNAEKCDSICNKIGFATFGRGADGKTDSSYIGHALYFTTSAEYADEIYSDGRNLLVGLLATTEPYPCLKEDIANLKGRKACASYDTHYALVEHVGEGEDSLKKDYRPSETPTCDDIAIFHTTQTLPRFWVVLRKNFPFSPSTPRLGDRILKQMLDRDFNLIPQEDPVLPEIKELLKSAKKTEERAYVFFAHLADRPGSSKKWLEECNAPEFTDPDPSRFFTHQRESLRALLAKLGKAHGLPDEDPCPVYTLANELAASPFALIKEIAAFFSPETRKRDQTLLEDTFTSLHLAHLMGRPLDNEASKIHLLVLRPLYFYLQKKESKPLVKPASLPVTVEDKKSKSPSPLISLPIMAVKDFVWDKKDELPNIDPLIDQMKSLIPEEQEAIYRLLSRNTYFEPLREKFIENLPEGTLRDELALISNPGGFRQSMRLEQKKLCKQILAITQETPSGVAIRCPFFEGTRYLKPELIKSVIDDQDQGNIKSAFTEKNKNRHLVGHLQAEGVDLYLKQQPDHPMQEYAVYSLSSRIAGRGVPPSTLLRFDVNLNGIKKSYPVLASQAVFGDNLETILKNTPKKNFSSFLKNDSQSPFSPYLLTHRLLLELLICPGDGRAPNYIVTNKKDDAGKKEIISVDNDVCFVEPLEKKRIGHKVNFSSILYCLDPQTLDQSAIDEWLKLSPYVLLSHWIEDLVARENSYMSLFSEKERKELYEKNPDMQFIPSILLRAGTMARLFTQLHHLQRVLKENPSLNSLDLLKHLITLRGNELGINSVGESLSFFYQKAHQKSKDPIERWKIATNSENQSLSTPDALKATLGKVPSIEEIEKRQHYSLDKLKQEFNIFAISKHENGVFLTSSENKEALEINFQSITKEGEPDIERQDLILQGLQQIFASSEKAPTAISFNHCPALTMEKLISFLHPGLSYLEINNCSNLKKFVQPKLLRDQPLILPSSLKTLIIANCDQLTSIQIESNHLKLFRSFNNKNLNTLFPKVHIATLFDVQGSAKINLDQILSKQVPIEWINTLSPDNLLAFGRLLEYIVNSTPEKQMTIAKFVLDICKQKLNIETFLPSADENLTSLDLKSKNIDVEGAKAIAKLLQWTNLTSLDLSGNNIGHEGARAIAEHLQGTSLTSLDLSGNNIGHEGVRAIAEYLQGTNLTSLHLLHNKIGNRGVKALAEHLQGTNLTFLNLEFNEIDNEGAKAIAKHLQGTNLTSLNLRYNWISDEGASIIAEHLQGTNLISLNLDGNKISDKGARGIAEHLQGTNLTRLYLDSTGIGYKGVKAIAEHLQGTNLISLDLSYNSIDEEGVKAIAEHLQGTNLTSLDLSSNRIGNRGAQIIAEHLKGTNLTSLNLKNNKIGYEGAKAIAEHLQETNLTSLNLANNHIAYEGAKAIAEYLQGTNLTSLDLANNYIVDAGAKAIAEHLQGTNLTFLDLSRNNIEYEGAKAIAEYLQGTNLTSLDLNKNKIGYKGVKAIAEHLQGTNLTFLNLSSTGTDSGGIGYEGVEVIAEHLQGTNLTDLHLGFNKIGYEGAKAIAEHLSGTKLTYLHLNGNDINNIRAKELKFLKNKDGKTVRIEV